MEILTRLQELDSSLFPAGLSLGYLMVKTVTKGMCRTVAGLDYDLRETAAWFGVDLILWTIAVSIAINVPGEVALSGQGTTVWYLVLAFLFIVAVLAYGMYVQARKAGRRWLRWVGVLTAVVVGLGPFLYLSDLLLGRGSVL